MLDHLSPDDQPQKQPAASGEAAPSQQQRSLLGEAVHQVVGLAWGGDSTARATTENVITQVAANVSYFVGGKFGYIGSAALSALNSTKTGESAGEMMEDLALGSVKGLATRGAFQYFGGQNMNFAMKGMAMGVSQRTLDVGLNRQTYLDGDGKFTLGTGLALAGAEALAPKALLVDVATFGVMSRSPWKNVALTGFAAGATSGAISEVQNELDHNEPLNPGKILGSIAEQGAVMSVSSMLGHKLTPAGTAAVIRPMETRIEPSQPASKTLGERLDGLKSMLGMNDQLVPAAAGVGAGNWLAAHQTTVEPATDRAQILKMTADESSTAGAGTTGEHSEAERSAHHDIDFERLVREEKAKEEARDAWATAHKDQVLAAKQWVAELKEHQYEHNYSRDRYQGVQALPFQEAQHIAALSRGEPEAVSDFHKAISWEVPPVVMASSDIVSHWADQNPSGDLTPAIYHDLVNSDLFRSLRWYHGAFRNNAEAKIHSVDFEHAQMLQTLHQHFPYNMENMIRGISFSSTRAGVEASSVHEWLRTHRGETLTEDQFKALPFHQMTGLANLIDSLNADRGAARRRPEGTYPLTEKEMQIARYATTVDAISSPRLFSSLGAKAEELMHSFSNRGIEASRFSAYLMHWSTRNPNIPLTKEVLDEFMTDQELQDGRLIDALKRKDKAALERPAGDLAITQEEMEQINRLAKAQRYFNHQWTELFNSRGHEAGWLLDQAREYARNHNENPIPADELQRLGTSDMARALRLFDNLSEGREKARELPSGDSPITLQEAKHLQELQKDSRYEHRSQMAFGKRSLGALKMAEEISRLDGKKTPLTQDVLEQIANTREMRAWRLVDALRAGTGNARQVPDGAFPVTADEASLLDVVVGPNPVAHAFKYRSPEAGRFADLLYASRDPHWGWNRNESNPIDPARYLRVGIAARQFEMNAAEFATPYIPEHIRADGLAADSYHDARSFMDSSQGVPDDKLPSYFATWSKLIAANPVHENGSWVDPKTVRQITDLLPADANLSGNQLQGLYDRIRLEGSMPQLPAEQLLTAARAWANEPALPEVLALEVGSQGRRQWLSGAIAWHQALAKLGAASPGQLSAEQSTQLHSVFREQMNKLDELNPRSLLRALPNSRSIPDAVDLQFENTLSPADRAQLSKALLKHTRMPVAGETDDVTATDAMAIRDPYNVIASVSAKTFADALRATEKHGQSDPRAALAGSLIFRGSVDQWLNMQSNFDRNLHDATYWLPVRPGETNAGLGPALIKNGKSRLVDLEMMAREWPNLDAAMRKAIDDGKLADVLQDLRSRTYPGYKSLPFASEAATWGVKSKDYATFEKRFMDSQSVPVPFSLEARWKSGNLTGRFLPRSDARGLFLGQYTNCCQHPYGQASTSAWHGQESPDSAFFVVENPHGEIVGGSWVYLSKKGGVVFDNVEAKGLGKRISAVQEIVESAARTLSKQFGKITLGTKHSDVDTSKWEDTVPLPLPANYEGYTDAGIQVLLADAEN